MAQKTHANGHSTDTESAIAIVCGGFAHLLRALVRGQAVVCRTSRLRRHVVLHRGRKRGILRSLGLCPRIVLLMCSRLLDCRRGVANLTCDAEPTPFGDEVRIYRNPKPQQFQFPCIWRKEEVYRGRQRTCRIVDQAAHLADNVVERPAMQSDAQAGGSVDRTHHARKHLPTALPHGPFPAAPPAQPRAALRRVLDKVLRGDVSRLLLQRPHFSE